MPFKVGILRLCFAIWCALLTANVDAFFNAPTFAVRSAHQMAKQSLSMPTLKGILPSGALGDRGYQERRFLLPKLKGAISVIPSILQSLEGTVIKMSGYGRKR